MTEQRLNEISIVCDRIRELNALLKATYSAYRSPLLTGSKSIRQCADPTANAAYKALEMQSEREKLFYLLADFERELSQITDFEIVAIIRWRYIMGLSWTGAARRMYGCSKSGLYCKRKVVCFLQSCIEYSSEE